MKGKKSAFAHTSTGYGRHKHSSKANNSSKGEKTAKPEKAEKDKRTPEHAAKEEQDKDLNSGFGDYLRTPEAFEMMKLFVFANTVMLIVTMAWPNIREQFFMLNQWWESFKLEKQI